MQHLYPALLLCLLGSCTLHAQCPDLIWSDEFDGDALNLDNWSYEIGDGCDRNLCGWGNQELQSYQEENAVVSDGTLKITARQETIGNSEYTSARLISRGKQDFTYGRMEARIKVPAGQGTWPAFWMLPTDEAYGGWPQSGEIDIMEYVGREPNQVLGTIHYGQPWPNNSFTGGSIELEEPVASDFHEFAIEWDEDVIHWFLDGILYSTKTPEDLGGERWPFDQDFFFILNQAVGGTLGGAVDPSTYPAVLEVDYVRVYAGGRPYITGERQVANAATDISYTIGNVADDAAVEWTIPNGATITEGEDTPSITVDWTGSGGTLTAVLSLPCGNDTLSFDVEVDPAYERARSFENFDEEAELVFDFASGTLTEIENPAPDSINSSATVGSYVRSADAQYDVLIYNVSTIPDADIFSDGTERFYVDVYTDAPIGTEILLQLETAAAGDNYPIGRHSRYQAFTGAQNTWERLYLAPLDRPDPTALATEIIKYILLIAPNTNTGDTYLIDNLDVFVQQTTGLIAPTVADFPLMASPNPVSDVLRLSLSLPQITDVSVELYTLAGSHLSTTRYGKQSAGATALSLPVHQLASGVYVARVVAGGRSASVRFVR